MFFGLKPLTDPRDGAAATTERRSRRSAATSLGPSHEGSYRPDIDGLRALSVIAVVAYHAVPDWVPGGFVGVDVFFVISGFLISNIIFGDIRRGTFSFRRFYARRIRRIFPALALVLVAVWLVGWFLLLPAEFQRLGRDIAAAAGFASNIVFWQDVGYFDQSASLKPLLHLWSLGVEEQYYIVWPLTVVLASKLRRGLPAVMVMAAIASFAANVAAPRPEDAFYLPDARFWELLAGGAIAYGQVFGQLGDTIRFRNTLAIAALILLGVAVFGLHHSLRYPGWWALLPVSAAMLLIVAGPAALLNRHVLSSPPLVLIGLISYPLYLWHWPLLSLARIIAPEDLSGSTIAGLVAVAVALAWLTYSLVELPIRMPARRVPATRVAPALVLLMAAVGIAGVGISVAGGFPARFPAILDDTKAVSVVTYTADYRARSCFVGAENGPATFADACVDPPGPSKVPLLVLWGDSHAAHLYPGLHELQKTRQFRLAQYTSTACPPYLGVDIPSVPFCRPTNRQILQRVAALQPDWVILSAVWSAYSSLLPIAGLDDSIGALKGVGIKNILVVGPDPGWKPTGLVRMLYDSYRQSGTVPWRIDFAIGVPRAFDRQMRERSERLGALYVSLIDILCNEDGCLTRVGDAPSDLTFADATHLSVAGSRFVAEHLPAQLFQSPAR